MARAGKIAVRGGVAPQPYVHFGISIRALRRYKMRRTAIPDCTEVKKLRIKLRSAFRRYMIDCATIAPTATERRKALARIKTSAARLASIPNRPNAWVLLDALDTPDLGARHLVYRALRTRAGPFKRSLRNWRIASPADPAVESSVEAPATAEDPEVMSAIQTLAGLDIEALVPASGRFPKPALAHLVAALVPVWKGVTGRKASGLGTHYIGGLESKTCLFADWLGELHGLIGLPPPSLWSIVDIVKKAEGKEK